MGVNVSVSVSVNVSMSVSVNTSVNMSVNVNASARPALVGPVEEEGFRAAENLPGRRAAPRSSEGEGSTSSAEEKRG